MWSQTWQRGFDVAKAAREHASAPREGLKIGAALFAKSALLSIGFNTYNVTHPNSANNKNFNRNIHAEHRAIIKRQHYDNATMTMYIYRAHASGKVANAKPCKQCLQLMREAGVTCVRYSMELGYGELCL